MPFITIFGLNVAILLSWTLVHPLRWERIQIDEINPFGSCVAKNNAWVYFLTAIVLVNSITLISANIEAYRARKISDEFSESVYIGFAMISLLQALLLGMPMAIIVNDNPSAKLFTFAGILFIMCMALLLLIFILKMMFVKRYNREKSRRSTEQGTSNSGEGMRIQCRGSVNFNRSHDEQRESQSRASVTVPINLSSDRDSMISPASDNYQSSRFTMCTGKPEEGTPRAAGPKSTRSESETSCVSNQDFLSQVEAPLYVSPRAARDALAEGLADISESSERASTDNARYAVDT